ncbi:MAG: SPOR domain-containing protein [Betaproteobacteria bacterium]|nr:SPOR domain-containing protein [Betaproteobacteria bacterium]
MDSSNSKQQRGGTLLGLFLGLVIGVMIAFGVVWYLNKTPLPFLDKLSRPEKPETKPGAAPQAPQPLPGKPGDKVNEKPRFEFYKILPSGQEAAPAPADAKPQPNAAPAAAEVPLPPVETLYLQAGAFQKPADADNLKAKLALMGLEASVQEVNIPDKGIMHRVRVGPFAKPEEMNRVRTQLSQNGIQASVVKAKESPAAPAHP